MTIERVPEKKEILSEEDLVAAYLRFEGVGKVFRKYGEENVAFSVPTANRILERWRIVKSAGPNREFSEWTFFIEEWLKDKNVDALYKYLPVSLKTSIPTFYRILSETRENIITRWAAALVITPEGNKDLVLVGNDMGVPRLKIGKPEGALTLAMGYAKKNETARVRITRVMQREVFTKKVLQGEFPWEVVPQRRSPFMYIDIGNVRVPAYHLNLPPHLCGPENFSSFRIENYRWENVYDFGSLQGVRAGVKEIVRGYKERILEKREAKTPLFEKSLLNQMVALAFS